MVRKLLDTPKAVYARKYYIEHREQILAQTKEWARSHPKAVRRYGRARQQRLKLEVVQHYSKGTMMCHTCGETDIVVLCIDHIKGGGLKHRNRVGPNIYQWLKANNYPPGYQVLCANCNTRKRFTEHEFRPRGGDCYVKELETQRAKKK